ncbi:MAG: DUF1697 domain-containing protein [Anaerolineae bacterium]
MTAPLAVFLRGINVGGIQIKMDALKSAFAEMGFSDVQTVLASGNVVANPPAGVELPELKSSIERDLSDRFQYAAHVLLRTPEAITTVLSAARAIPVPEDIHLYVLLCDDPNLPAELQSLFDAMPHLAEEQFRPVGGEALWAVPKGSTLKSNFGDKVLGSRKYKARLTSRNVQTIEKVHTLLRTHT